MNSKIGSIKGLRMRLALVLVTAFAAMSASSAPVAAASGPAFVGACNMVRAGTGMIDIAMTRDNSLGNIGMFRAVGVSGGNC